MNTLPFPSKVHGFDVFFGLNDTFKRAGPGATRYGERRFELNRRNTPVLQKTIGVIPLWANITTRLNPLIVVERPRRTSEPCLEVETREEMPQTHLTVQCLSHDGRREIRNITNSNTLAIPSVSSPSEEAHNEEDLHPHTYMRYLSNLSTVTINNGREFRNVPAYLQQFEMSRLGTMTSTVSKPLRRRGAIHEEGDEQTPSPSGYKKPSNKVVRAIRTVVSRHRSFGFRHWLFFLILVLFHISGMFMFHAIEAPYEQTTTLETRAALNEALENLASELGIPFANKSQLLKDAYLTLIKIDGKYDGSTFYKLEERDYIMWTWTYGTAFFFSYTIYTTIGYGSIACSTVWGKAATIAYIAIGFPLALVVIRDIGSVWLVYLTRFYAKIIRMIREARGYTSSSNEAIMIPMKLAFTISLSIVLCTTTFVMLYDDWLGPEPGLDFFHSFYFVFITYTATGLGDLMPVNEAHAPLVAIVVLCGFPMMRVINRIVYVSIENGMYGSMTFVEASIDRVAPEKNENEDRMNTVGVNVESGSKPEDNLSRLEEDEEGNNRIRNQQLNNLTIRSASAIEKENCQNEQNR